MKRVFEIIDMANLEEIINRWQRIALTTEGGNYEEAGERTDLIDFCEGLKKLVEVTYSLQRKSEWEDEERVKWKLSEELKQELLAQEQVLLLSDEEIVNPSGVLQGFFYVFSAPYALRELWDMLDSVISNKREGLDKTDQLLEYKCLRAVLEASWLLLNGAKNEDETNKKEAT